MMRAAKSKKVTEELTLDQVPTGGRVRIVRIEAGHSLKNRLTAMGFLADEPIEVIRNDHRGQVIIAVKNSKIVLGRGMSHKIYVH
jgi:ferrous iron transport protein A